MKTDGIGQKAQDEWINDKNAGNVEMSKKCKGGKNSKWNESSKILYFSKLQNTILTTLANFLFQMPDSRSFIMNEERQFSVVQFNSRLSKRNENITYHQSWICFAFPLHFNIGFLSFGIPQIDLILGVEVRKKQL